VSLGHSLAKHNTVMSPNTNAFKYFSKKIWWLY